MNTKLYKAFLESNPKLIYITEFKEDADLFKASGYSAMTSETDESERMELTEFISQHRSVVYVLAFNTSHNLRDYADLLETMKVKYYALLPEQGTRWSEPLLSENQNAALMRGKLALATTEQEIVELNYQDRGEEIHNTIFCFDGATYIVKINNDQPIAHKLLNGTLIPKYYLSHIGYRGRLDHYYILTVRFKDGSTTTLKVTNKELNCPKTFMDRLVTLQLSFFHKSTGFYLYLAALAKDIRSQPCAVLRKPNSVGYDHDSDCYVFPGFLYDSEGKYHKSDEHGVFNAFSLAGPSTPVGCKVVSAVEEDANLETILHNFYKAYGISGIFLLGAYISSHFSQVFNTFPLIENTGNPVHRHLNRMFMLDFNGILLNQVEPLEKIARNQVHFSSGILAFEENNGPVKLKEHGLLPVYARQSIETLKVSHRTEHARSPVLYFHRSYGNFTAPDMLACSVTVETQASNDNHVMSNYPAKQLAVVGHTVLTNRQYFVSNLAETTDKVQQRLVQGGARDDVAYNHGVILAGAELLIKKLNLDFIDQKALYDYTQNLSLRRTEQLTHLYPLADQFFDVLFNHIDIANFGQMNKIEAEQQVYVTGTAIMADKLLVTLPMVFTSLAFKKAFSQGYTNKPPQLLNQLQQHPAYLKHEQRLRIARSSATGKQKQMRYWVFDLTQITTEAKGSVTTLKLQA